MPKFEEEQFVKHLEGPSYFVLDDRGNRFERGFYSQETADKFMASKTGKAFLEKTGGEELHTLYDPKLARMADQRSSQKEA